MAEILHYLPGILLAHTAFLIAIMSPGPNVLAVIGTSMALGRRSGIALANGVALGSFLWALMTAVGLSALLSVYASALIAIKIAGGLYLLWLSYKAFRAAASAHDLQTQQLAGEKRSPVGYFLRGLAIQMTNPKAALAWIAIMSLGLQDNAPVWVVLVIVIGTSVSSFILHYLYAVAFSTPPMLRFYSRARRWIQAALGAFFAFAGVRLLTSRL
jgi:threonine/homoserine/homoserine lactone efflux protein